MRKEYVVKSVNTSPNGSPYVIVSLTLVKDLQEEHKSQSQFDLSKINPDNMNDMMKNLNKMLSGMGMQGGITQLKLEMHEYKEMNLSVGDKVYLDMTKAESLGI